MGLVITALAGLVKQGRHGGQQIEQQAALGEHLAPLIDVTHHHLGLATVVLTPGIGVGTHLMGLCGGQLHRIELQTGKAVAQLGGAGKDHVVEGVFTQHAAEGGKHQAGIARFAAGQIAHFDNAVACRIDPEAGIDGILDGLLQILFQIERSLTGMIETTGTDQRPVRPIEPQQAGEKMGDAGVELEGVGGLDGRAHV